MPAGAFSDQKFLVVTNKPGGEDNYGMLIPRDTTRLGVIEGFRPTLRYTAGEIAATALDANFALHPQAGALLPAWEAGEMIVCPRVGIMYDDVRGWPRSRIVAAMNPFYTGSDRLPFRLGAHDWQQFAMSSQIPGNWVDGSGNLRTPLQSGFLGRMATRFAGFVGGSSFPITHQSGNTNGGSALINVDGATRPIALPTPGQSFSLNEGASAIAAEVLAQLAPLRLRALTGERLQTFNAQLGLAATSAAFYEPVVASGGSFAVDSHFTAAVAGPWGLLLRQVARTIERRNIAPTLPSRTVFYLSQGDYDTHGSQRPRYDDQTLDWARACAAFRAAMIAIEQWEQCVLFDLSEFGRTLPQNGGLGTDHAWAGVRFALGGMVRGRGKAGGTGYFGTYPAVLGIGLAGSDDIAGGEIGNGSLIPDVAFEEYLAEFLDWFGATSDDLNVILPRRAVFGAPLDTMLTDAQLVPRQLLSVSVTTASATSITWGWAAAARAASYDIRTRPAAGAWSSVINQAGLSYVLSGLSPGNYEIEVSPKNAVGNAAPTYNTASPVGTTKVLDAFTFSELRGVWGLRLARIEYSGSIIRVRGFSSGNEVDVTADPASFRHEVTANSPVTPTTWGATLGAFIAHASGGNSGDCGVRTYYDLTGLGRHQEQATQTSMPLIVVAGVLQTSGGRTVTLNGTSRWARWTGASNVFATNNLVMGVLGTVSGNSGTLISTHDSLTPSPNYGTAGSMPVLGVDQFSSRTQALRGTSVLNGGTATTTRLVRCYESRASDNRNLGDNGEGPTATATITGPLAINRVSILRGSDVFSGGGHNGGDSEMFFIAEPADPSAFQSAIRSALLA